MDDRKAEVHLEVIKFSMSVLLVVCIVLAEILSLGGLLLESLSR